ncbi:MAG: glycosyltransferase family 4 protein [Cyanobacteria bacterium P01_G01_bin.39]
MSKVILSGSRNIKKFNHPRKSSHEVIDALPISLRKIWKPLDAIDIRINSSLDYQLIHSFNRIPYTTKPWIITFESSLPRILKTDIFKNGAYALKKRLTERLALENCKKIIAMSEYAKNIFVQRNKDIERKLLEKIIDKVEVIHPNIVVKSRTPKQYKRGETLKMVFIGNNFARKGGFVVLRLADEAQKRGLPVDFHIVSALNYGSHVYTDHSDNWRYDEDLKLLNLSNVTFYEKIANQKVIQLLSESHLQIMPTFHDTYGFSIIEGFSVATPAITTNVCALPEIVHPDKNGYLLNLEVNQNNGWNQIYPRGSQNYWDRLDSTSNDLVAQALKLLQELLDSPNHYEQLSAGAIAQAEEVHSSEKTGELLDNLYTKIANGLI